MLPRIWTIDAVHANMLVKIVSQVGIVPGLGPCAHTGGPPG